MKVWPIITLVGLIYGSTLADPKGVGRESNPHPHRSSLDAEVAADFAQPHRPVTMAFREVFQKLLNEETDWSAPDGKATAQAEADADDGQDPGKKLFWSTTHSDVTGVPFTGWGDPNAEPDHPLVSPPACSTCRPELFFYIIDDPAPPKEDENVAVEAQAHIIMGDLPFGALKALDNMCRDRRGRQPDVASPRVRRSWSTASALAMQAQRSPVRGRSAAAAAADRGRSCGSH